MMKKDEIADLKSCWNKAGDMETVFVLLERDAATPSTIRFWVSERIRLGLNVAADDQIVRALATASVIERLNGRNK